MVHEKRWLVMKKIAFYIVERPPHQHQSNSGNNGTGSEFKDSSPECENLAPIEVTIFVMVATDIAYVT